MTGKLTPGQERFAQEVAKGKSQSAAYRSAYPRSRKWKDKSVWERSSALAAKVKVASRIKELKERVADKALVSVEQTLREIARLAFFDIRKLVQDDGAPVPLQDLDDDTAAAISGLDIARVGNADIGVGEVLKFRIADKNAALEKLAKHLGLYETDNRQKTDPWAELARALTGNIAGPGGVTFPDTRGARNKDAEGAG